MSAIPPKVRAQVEYRSGGRCEAQIHTHDHRCKGVASVIHHKQRREVGGHVLDNLIHLCSTPVGGLGEGCHEFVHANPEWSRSVGFIVSSYETPRRRCESRQRQ